MKQRIHTATKPVLEKQLARLNKLLGRTDLVILYNAPTCAVYQRHKNSLRQISPSMTKPMLLCLLHAFESGLEMSKKPLSNNLVIAPQMEKNGSQY